MRFVSKTLVGAFAGALALAASTAPATPLFSEIFINPPGSDDGNEFVEIVADPNESLAGVTLLIFEGGAGTGAGTIDVAIDLGAQTAGANGLLLIRDTSAVLDPAPDADTSVFVQQFTNQSGSSDDIENGSGTFLLVTGFSGTLGQDLDADDDGVLDSTPWTTVLDGVGIIETAGEFVYAPATAVETTPPNAFTPDILFRHPVDGLIGADVTGTAPGPFTVDPAEVTNVAYDAYVASPGVPNFPGPSSVDGWALYE